MDFASSLQDYQFARDRERRRIRPPSRYLHANYVSKQTESESLSFELASYEEAVCCKESKKWLAAMQEEMDYLYKNQTWDLVEKPSNCKLVDCKWLYQIKEGNIKGGDKKYKVKLVAKGFAQEEGLDYNDIFSLVVKYTSLGFY